MEAKYNSFLMTQFAATIAESIGVESSKLEEVSISSVKTFIQKYEIPRFRYTDLLWLHVYRHFASGTRHTTIPKTCDPNWFII
ncbi:hypothetical protein SAMN05443246_3611 [Paenibacillus sp. GP183]|jgi:hypothetical protein|nr:hypothetical protein SAMN05443246_3611 [Paenibacillus sp. GP183]